MKKFNLYVLILIFASCGINENKGKIRTISLKKDNSRNRITNYQFISLDDSSSDALFSGISKIVVKNDYIFVFDGQGTKLIYMYDNEGKYLKTIGKVGQGPSEYSNVRDFNVDENCIYIYDDKQRKLLVYNYVNNTFKHVIKTKFAARAFSLLDNGNILFVLPKDQKYNQIVITNKNTNIIRSYLKFKKQDKDDRTRYSLLQENISEKIITYNKPNTDVVYTISKTDGSLLDSCKINVKGVDHKKVYLNTTPIVFKNNMIGNYIYENTLNFYHIENFNRTKGEITGNIEEVNFKKIELSKVLLPVGISEDGTTIISYITQRILESSIDKEIVRYPQKKHLEKGGYVLCKYKIENVK